MRVNEILLNAIYGFVVGFSITPIGDADDEEGFLIVELGIFRIIIVYS